MFPLLALIVYTLYATGGNGIVMPLVRSHGSLDLSSLSSRISHLEKTIETKSSAAETTQIKSQLQTTQSELKVTQSKLETAQDGLKASETEITQLKTQLRASQLIDQIGVTYIRWGRTECPIGSEVIYKGHAGGSWYKNKGAPSSMLCLVENPTHAQQSPFNALDPWSTLIYSAEYETGNPGNPFGTQLNHDMPCVVCGSVTKKSIIMVPGTNQCELGWNQEYWGYLMASGLGFASSETICVDSDPESIPNSAADQDGQLLYMIRTTCSGTIPCPPYTSYGELTCAVCTN